MTNKTDTLTLKYPVEYKGRKITELSLRRPTVLDIELMEKESGDLAKSIRLLSSLSELSLDEIRAMDAADFTQASGKVADFLE